MHNESLYGALLSGGEAMQLKLAERVFPYPHGGV
jgi:hypothetical protein